MGIGTRRVAIGVIALLVAITGVSSAHGRTVRRDRQQYNYTSGSAGPSGTDGQITLGKVTFATEKAETWIRVSIADTTGMDVRALLTQDHDGDGSPEREVEFCSKTDGAVAIKGGLPVEVSILDGPCADNSAAVATSGWVDAAFGRP